MSCLLYNLMLYDCCIHIGGFLFSEVACLFLCYLLATYLFDFLTSCLWCGIQKIGDEKKFVVYFCARQYNCCIPAIFMKRWSELCHLTLCVRTAMVKGINLACMHNFSRFPILVYLLSEVACLFLCYLLATYLFDFLTSCLWCGIQKIWYTKYCYFHVHFITEELKHRIYLLAFVCSLAKYDFYSNSK